MNLSEFERGGIFIEGRWGVKDVDVVREEEECGFQKVF